jgi:hypothetical protein
MKCDIPDDCYGCILYDNCKESPAGINFKKGFFLLFGMVLINIMVWWGI